MSAGAGVGQAVLVNGFSSDVRRVRSISGGLLWLGACCLPVVIPSVHLYIFYWWWEDVNFKVTRDTCKCNCWDTVFKGPYESGEAAYKHIYFNVTPNTFKIWAVTVMYMVALYEVGKQVIRLTFLRQIRLPLLVLLSFGVYPNYYAWWSYFNYWNDDFYSQWYHQLYFSMTELLSTAFVFRLLDAKRPVPPRELLVILAVATAHVSASLYDQFVYNVLAGGGSLHQVLRDLGFMTPDLLHLWLPWRELRKLSRPLGTLFTAWELTMVAAFVVASWMYLLIL